MTGLGDSPQKRLVLALLDEAFNRHNPAAASGFLAEGYVQHNAEGQTDRAGFVERIETLVAEHPEMSIDFKRVIEDGPLVAVHLHWKSTPEDSGIAVADFFRLENDRVAEHWDVLQPVPEDSTNQNGMF